MITRSHLCNILRERKPFELSTTTCVTAFVPLQNAENSTQPLSTTSHYAHTTSSLHSLPRPECFRCLSTSTTVPDTAVTWSGQYRPQRQIGREDPTIPMKGERALYFIKCASSEGSFFLFVIANASPSHAGHINCLSLRVFSEPGGGGGPGAEPPEQQQRPSCSRPWHP